MISTRTNKLFWRKLHTSKNKNTCDAAFPPKSLIMSIKWVFSRQTEFFSKRHNQFPHFPHFPHHLYFQHPFSALSALSTLSAFILKCGKCGWCERRVRKARKVRMVSKKPNQVHASFKFYLHGIQYVPTDVYHRYVW